MNHDSHPHPSGEMHARRTTMEDGRYLIFYTFEGIVAPVSQAESHVQQDEPQAAPVATEERRV